MDNSTTTGFMQEVTNEPPPQYTVTTWPENGFQLCPKCKGEGSYWSAPISMKLTCPVCLGKMIISCTTGKPPQ